LAEPCLAAEAFRSGRQDAELPGVHAMADRFVPVQAALDGFVPDAPEIWMAGQPAWH